MLLFCKKVAKKSAGAVVLAALLLVISHWLFVGEAMAFTGPSSGAGVGVGAIGVDAGNNLSIGTSSPAANTKLLIVASSTDTVNYAFRVLQPSGNTPILVLRNDGSVGIGTGSPGAGYPLDIVGNTRITGTLTATSYTGTIAAANVTAGVFGSSQGSSPYAFPASLGVATSTQVNLPQSLSVYGSGYFAGSVGIGTPTPNAKLDFGGALGTTLIRSDGTDTWFVRSAPAGYDDVLWQRWQDHGFRLYDFTAGGELFYVLQNNGNVYMKGNVGIGTAPASAKLTLANNVYVPPFDAYSKYQILLYDTGVAGTSYGIGVESGHMGFNANIGYKFYRNGASTPDMTITGGSVGIGTASPNEKLTVLTPGGGTPFGATGVDVTTFGTAQNAKSSYFFRVRDLGAATTPFYIQGDGAVGIGTSSPAYNLDVVGTARFSQPVVVGTPTQGSHAATKSYVDSIASGTSALACNGDPTCEMNNADLLGGNIVGVNKLTVATIDPLYQIGEKKYASYGPSVVGGVKEEFFGRGQLKIVTSTQGTPRYEQVIDFDNVPQGSDLWVWFHVVEFSRGGVQVFLTAYGEPATMYYLIEGHKIVIRGTRPVPFSYQLVGRRFDWRDWPTKAKEQSETPNFVIPFPSSTPPASPVPPENTTQGDTETQTDKQ